MWEGEKSNTDKSFEKYISRFADVITVLKDKDRFSDEQMLNGFELSVNRMCANYFTEHTPMMILYDV